MGEWPKASRTRGETRKNHNPWDEGKEWTRMFGRRRREVVVGGAPRTASRSLSATAI